MSLPAPPKPSLGPAWGCGGAQGDPLPPGLSAHPSLRCRVLPARPFQTDWTAGFALPRGAKVPLGINSTPCRPLRLQPRLGSSRRLWPGWRLGSPQSPHSGSGSLLKHLPSSSPASGSWGFRAPASPQHAAPGRRPSVLHRVPSMSGERASQAGDGRALDPALVPSVPSSPTGRALDQAGVTLTLWVVTETRAQLCRWRVTGSHWWGARGHRVMAVGARKGGCPHPGVSCGAGLRLGNSSHSWRCCFAAGFGAMLRPSPLSALPAPAPEDRWDPHAGGLTPRAPIPCPGLAPAIPTAWSRWTMRWWPGRGDTVPPQGEDPQGQVLSLGGAATSPITSGRPRCGRA